LSVCDRNDGGLIHHANSPDEKRCKTVDTHHAELDRRMAQVGTPVICGLIDQAEHLATEQGRIPTFWRESI